MYVITAFTPVEQLNSEDVVGCAVLDLGPVGIPDAESLSF